MLTVWSPLPIASAPVVDLTLTHPARPFSRRSGQRRDRRACHRTRGQASSEPGARNVNEDEARRSRWLVEAKLDSSAREFSKRSGIICIMGLRLCCDQFEGAEFPCMELRIHRAHTMELTYKDRVLPKPTNDMEPFNDNHLYLETSETCGSLTECPGVVKCVGEQLHLESSAAKERRKAADGRSGAGAKK